MEDSQETSAGTNPCGCSKGLQDAELWDGKGFGHTWSGQISGISALTCGICDEGAVGMLGCGSAKGLMLSLVPGRVRLESPDRRAAKVTKGSR